MSAATVAAIAKAAVAVLSNEKTRKALGWVIVAILSPLIVLVVLICAVLSGSSQHNVSAVELCFHGGTISSSATPEYRGYIEDMDDPMGQSPAAAVITLFHSLANIFREQNQLPSGGIMVAVDRKLLRKIKAKKIAQGHKADDHEPKIGLQ